MKNESMREQPRGSPDARVCDASRAGPRGARIASAVGIAGCLLLGGCTQADREGRVDLAGRGATGNAPANASIQAALDLAEHERAIGDFAGAVSFYRRALELDPRQHQALLGLGYALLDSGAPNEAADAFHGILDKSPNDPGAESGLGETLLALDQPAAAADRLHKGLAVRPDARGYRALGIAEDLLGQFPEASADYQNGLALAPDDLALRDDLGLSQVLAGDFDDGIANLRAAATAPGAEARHRLNLALGLGLAGRVADAERISRADLDQRSIESNIAYYAVLRGLPAKERAEALLRPTAQARTVQATKAR